MKGFVAAAAIGLIAIATAGTGASASYRSSAACTPATSIEAIVDDSGSMGESDPGFLRVSALFTLIDSPGNATRTLGALEFGSTANAVFRPQPIALAGPSMKAALDARIDYADLFTNYNNAFPLARRENPTAGAWILLTDGGHDIGPYLKGHRGGPPTYVIGIGIGPPGANPDANRLQQIAKDTGGKYYTSVDSGSLPGVVNDINAKLSCIG